MSAAKELWKAPFSEPTKSKRNSNRLNCIHNDKFFSLKCCVTTMLSSYLFFSLYFFLDAMLTTNLQPNRIVIIIFAWQNLTKLSSHAIWDFFTFLWHARVDFFVLSNFLKVCLLLLQVSPCNKSNYKFEFGGHCYDTIATWGYIPTRTCKYCWMVVLLNSFI